MQTPSSNTNPTPKANAVAGSTVKQNFGDHGLFSPKIKSSSASEDMATLGSSSALGSTQQSVVATEHPAMSSSHVPFGPGIIDRRPKLFPNDNFGGAVFLDDRYEWGKYFWISQSGAISKRASWSLKRITKEKTNPIEFAKEAARLSLAAGRLSVVNLANNQAHMVSSFWVTEHYFITVAHYTQGWTVDPSEFDKKLQDPYNEMATVDQSDDQSGPLPDDVTPDTVSVYLKDVNHETDVAIFAKTSKHLRVQHSLGADRLRSVESTSTDDPIWTAGWCGEDERDLFNERINAYVESLNRSEDPKYKELGALLARSPVKFHDMFEPNLLALTTGKMGKNYPLPLPSDGTTALSKKGHLTMGIPWGLSGSMVGYFPPDAAKEGGCVIGILKGDSEEGSLDTMIGFTEEIVARIQKVIETPPPDL